VGRRDDGNSLLVRVSTEHDPCLASNVAMVRLDSVPCEPPRVNLGPVSDTNIVVRPGYYFYGVILNTFASGTWPLTFQWQKHDQDTDQWVDLRQRRPLLQPQPRQLRLQGRQRTQLRIGFFSGTWRGDYPLRHHQRVRHHRHRRHHRPSFCPADFNNDGGVDGADVESFFAAWTATINPPTSTAMAASMAPTSRPSFTAWTAGGC
jgi:hypothetical protein